jgi:hypothetical protein
VVGAKVDKSQGCQQVRSRVLRLAWTKVLEWLQPNTASAQALIAQHTGTGVKICPSSRNSTMEDAPKLKAAVVAGGRELSAVCRMSKEVASRQDGG